MGKVVRYTFAFGGLWDLRNCGVAGCGLMRWVLTVIVRGRSFDMQEIGWLMIRAFMCDGTEIGGLTAAFCDFTCLHQ